MSAHTAGASNPFGANGWAHIGIAREEPQLFAFLYLSPYLQVDGLDALYASVSQPGVEECIMELGRLGKREAHELYLNIIVYTHVRWRANAGLRTAHTGAEPRLGTSAWRALP